MAILAQSSPGGGSLSVLYQVPKFKSASLKAFVACNRDSSDTTFRLSIAKMGAVDNSAQYLFFDSALPKNDSFLSDLGIDLDAQDELRVYASGQKVSFSLFGNVTP